MITAISCLWQNLEEALHNAFVYFGFCSHCFLSWETLPPTCSMAPTFPTPQHYFLYKHIELLSTFSSDVASKYYLISSPKIIVFVPLQHFVYTFSVNLQITSLVLVNPHYLPPFNLIRLQILWFVPHSLLSPLTFQSQQTRWPAHLRHRINIFLGGG